MTRNLTCRWFPGLGILLSLVLVVSFLSSCGDSGSTSQVSKGNATKEVETETQGSGAGTVVVTDMTREEKIRHNIPTGSSNWTLKITSPAKGDEWTQGKRYSIQWKKAKVGSYVKIELFNDTGLVQTVTGKTKNDGSYTWKVPTNLTTGTDYYFYLKSYTYHRDCAYYSAYDTYDLHKAIARTPKGWAEDADVLWTAWGYSTADGAKEATYGKCTASYSNCELIDLDGNNCTSSSSEKGLGEDFTITKAGGGGSSLKVSTPNGGESWTTGKSYDLKWSKGKAGAKVKIELLKSGKASLTISKSTKNDGKHKWKIPSTVKTGSKYKIKITSSTKKTITDSSDSNFTITKAGGGGSSLKVSTPNGGESWTTGKSYDLKWSKGDAGSKVKIELLKSGKASLTISKKTKNDGKHKWKIPSSVKTGSKYKIKITSSTKKTINDSSDKNFTITKAGGGVGTCTMKVRVGDESIDTYHPGKKVCLGETPKDVVCGTTGGAGPNYWATIKKVPKKDLNIYPCGSKNKYPGHGVDASYCGGTFEIHPWGFGNDFEKKCGW